MSTSQAEPWLRGNLGHVDAVRRAVLHALELAEEDVSKWCEGLTEEEIEGSSVWECFGGFSFAAYCAVAGSIADLCGGAAVERAADKRYAVGDGAWREEATLMEFAKGLEVSAERVLAVSPGSYEDARGVGKKMLPTSVGGLLVHCADHTQRHVGQVVTTAKVVVGMRQG